MANVFASHRGSDSASAEKLAAEIRSAGYEALAGRLGKDQYPDLVERYV